MTVRFLQVSMVVGTVCLPALAFAGQPSTDSPEPSYWILLALGALPLLLVVARQLRAGDKPIRVDKSEELP
jgi:hypothetical protein